MGLCRRKQRIDVLGEGGHALLQHRLLGVVLLGLGLNLARDQTPQVGKSDCAHLLHNLGVVSRYKHG